MSPHLYYVINHPTWQNTPLLVISMRYLMLMVHQQP